MFRDIAGKMFKQKAESNAGDRKSSAVEEADLVKAIMSETPQAFQAQMIESLKKTGLMDR
jgi:hypothetical protein